MPGDRRVLTVVLSISLLANLFLAGVVAGRFLLPGLSRPQAATMLRPGGIRTLPSPERMRYTLVMRSHAPALRLGRQRLKELRQAVKDAIALPHYDPALVARRFAELRAANQAQQTLQQTALVEALGQLSAQSRVSLIEIQKDNAANAGR
jgi:uncharacterized membrane protein